MRVLLVHNFYQIAGGEDSVVREELAMLQHHGVEAELFSVSNDDIEGSFAKLRTAAEVVYNPRARRILAAKIRQFAPDVVHIHNFFPRLSPSVLDACRDAGVPSVMTLHNFRILCPSAFLLADARDRERSLTEACWWTVPRKVYRDSYAATLAVAAMVEFHKRSGTWRHKVDRFVVTTAFARDKFVAGGLPLDRIVIKPHSVGRPLPAAPATREGALFVGRLSEEKGIRLLLEAWAGVDYPLTIIGDGPLADLVERQSEPGRIMALGRQPRDAVHSAMQKAKFLILPSTWHEMFGMSVIEAYSCGLPVIASALPSLSDVVEHGVTGLTFPPGDAAALSAAVRWAVSHPAALDAFGETARHTYEARYTPEENVRRLTEIYRSVCDDAKRAAARGHLAAEAVPPPRYQA